jgi:hypothetical protein
MGCIMEFYEVERSGKNNCKPYTRAGEKFEDFEIHFRIKRVRFSPERSTFNLDTWLADFGTIFFYEVCMLARKNCFVTVTAWSSKYWHGIFLFWFLNFFTYCYGTTKVTPITLTPITFSTLSSLEHAQVVCLNAIMFRKNISDQRVINEMRKRGFIYYPYYRNSFYWKCSYFHTTLIQLFTQLYSKFGKYL